ncbi:MAG: YkgJ family cysteine cluster protein [Deltaproteobacteria bacterium]|nr:YkgJ family cysteine cluster protein [Deltaproteobacteria bacterium]
MKHLLDNYLQLTTKIDALCRGIESALGEQITCHEGCSSCCTAITLFPIEAAALRYALDGLPPQEAESIRRHVAEKATGERCPLLSHHRCLLYNARPVICRTHGLPITYVENNLHKSDCCPLNMAETDSISGLSVIDLDKLNALLVSVNALYLSQTDATDCPERVTIAEAISGP